MKLETLTHPDQHSYDNLAQLDEFAISTQKQALSEILYGNLERGIDGSAFFAANKLKEVADRLLEHGDPDTTAVVFEIVQNNSLFGHEITPVMGKHSYTDERNKQTRLLSIYERDPETAKLLVDEDIAGFHGSRSGALFGILRHDGLLSAAESRNRGQLISSGEKTYSRKGGQRFISFADWRAPESLTKYAHSSNSEPLTIPALEETVETLKKGYIEYQALWGDDHPFVYNVLHQISDTEDLISLIKTEPDSEEVDLLHDNFPIAFGVTMKGFDLYDRIFDLPKGEKPENAMVCIVNSDIQGEFAVENEKVALDKLPVIAVPKDKIAKIKEIIERYGKNVKVIDISLLANQKRY